MYMFDSYTNGLIRVETELAKDAISATGKKKRNAGGPK